MTNFSYKIKEGFGPLKAYRFVVDVDGLGAGANVAVDVDGDAMTLPQAFTACAGYVSTSANGATNNELSVGTTGDPNKFLDDVTIASTTLVNEPFNGSAFDDPIDVTSVVGENLIVTNSGSAPIGAGEKLVTIVIIGYLDS